MRELATELGHWDALIEQLSYQAYTVRQCGLLQAGSYTSARQQARVVWLRERFRGSVLDVGGGIGKILEGYALPSVLVDAYPLHVATAKKAFVQSPHKAYCVDVRFGLPFDDDAFDTAICAEVLEHIRFSEAVRAVRELCRVAPNVVITLPYMCKGDYIEGDVENIEHRWSPTLELTRRLFSDAEIAASIDSVANDSFLGIQIER